MAKEEFLDVQYIPLYDHTLAATHYKWVDDLHVDIYGIVLPNIICRSTPKPEKAIVHVTLQPKPWSPFCSGKWYDPFAWEDWDIE